MRVFLRCMLLALLLLGCSERRAEIRYWEMHGSADSQVGADGVDIRD